MSRGCECAASLCVYLGLVIVGIFLSLCMPFTVDAEAEPADIHLAGTPCTDFSSRGNMQGFMGKTATHFFAWLAQRLRIQEPIIIQENVAGFITDVLQQAAGHLYDVQCVLLDPYQLGWPIGRVRKYTIMKHKIKAGYMRQPLSIFTHMFMRPPAPTCVDNMPAWDMFLIAGPRELEEELLWASQRPQSTWQDSDDTSLDPLAARSFHQVLTSTEQTFLTKYQAKAPSQVFQLNQNPDVMATVSETGRMFTIIKNAGLLWCLD